MKNDTIPEYPESRELDITDYHIIEPLLKKDNQENSDSTFTNIFTWRKTYKYTISEINDMIIVSGTYNAQKFILPPIGNKKRATKTILQIIEKTKSDNDKPFFAVIPEFIAKELGNIENIEVREDREDWDYVYKRKNLIELKGPAYHTKKNLVNQFEKKYDAQIETLNEATCNEAIDFSDKWCLQKDCESDDGLKKEKCAIYQMLKHFGILKLHGILVRVEDEIVALSIGEELNNDTYVVHVEKGDHKMRGIYQYINQKLAENIDDKYIWINREQDLGINGLRRAKLSYNPDHFVKKYIITWYQVPNEVVPGTNSL